MIKRWFLEKNFTANERYIIECAIAGGEMEVLKETEKAIQFEADSDFGIFKFWCPKSCLIENETEQERQQREDRAARFQNGLNYNETLVRFAKENGLKGIRTGMKTVTLIKKISEAGLTVPARA